MAVQRAYVVPEMLKWARETAGIELSVIAQKVKKDIEIITQWENGNEYPTMRQAEKLARIYKRPLAVFYLPEPPEEPIVPRFFRTLPYDIQHDSYSSETLLALRRTKRLQYIYKELYMRVNGQLKAPEIEEAELSSDPELVAHSERESFDVKHKEQIGWQNSYQAFRRWRQLLEKRGILILSISMPIEDGRAFTLMDDFSPAIVVNKKDSINGRIFSLFHEYAHILLRNQASGENLIRHAQKIEQFCNAFSGAFLLPNQDFYEVITNLTTNNIISQLTYLSNRFRVSSQVVLRRMLTLRIIDKDTFQQLNDYLAQQFKSSRGGPVSQAKKCITENGRPFVNLVLTAYHDGYISSSDVSDYLNVKLKHLAKIEEALLESN